MTRPEFEAAVRQAVSGISGEIIAGVSGGADSTAMLRALVSAGANVHVVTCDFHLRGDESTRDRRFVISLCQGLGVPVTEADMDVPAYMRQHGVSVEMACRDLRYGLFRQLMHDRGAARIAVAHNADDNIETLMLNLMRTTGIEGLRGMLPDTGEIIRPLLSMSRRDIEAYLHEIGQDFVTDSTNLADGYRRNFIRNRVLPLLEERFPNARRSIAATQRNLRGEAAVIARAVRPKTDGVLTWAEIQKCGDAMTAIQRFAAPHGANASQIAEMTALSRNPLPGRVWHLRTTDICSERDGLHIVPTSGDLALPEYRWFRLLNTPEARSLMRSMHRPTACFLPMDGSNYTLRFVRPGDRIAPLGMRGSSAVSDIMKDAKLTQEQKRRTVALTDTDGNIIWIDGLKRSRQHLIADDAQFIYAVTADPDAAAAIHAITGKC